MLKSMYSDEDGTALKESEAIYRDRIRTLCSLNSIITFLGVAAFTLSCQYARESKSWNHPIVLAEVLWASSSLRKVTKNIVNRG